MTKKLALGLAMAAALVGPAHATAQDATLEAGLRVAAIRFEPATVSVSRVA